MHSSPAKHVPKQAGQNEEVLNHDQAYQNLKRQKKQYKKEVLKYGICHLFLLKLILLFYLQDLQFYDYDLP